MIKIIKKSLIILSLITIKIIVIASRIIQKIYSKYNSKIKKIAKNFLAFLKKELVK